MPTRIIITGSRSWFCPELCIHILRRLIVAFPDVQISVGDCPSGVDRFTRDAARLQGIPLTNRKPFVADWGKYKLRAGPMRNGEMVKAGARDLIALHPDIISSKGTKDCVKQAFNSGIPCWLIDNDKGEAEEITKSLVRLL